MNIRMYAHLILIVLLTGCATQGISTFKYIPNAPTTTINELTISEQHSKVWDNLVKELSKSFFIINNIDKESRIINISFSTTTPSDYVDCGKSYRTYSQYGKTDVYEYNTANSAIFKEATIRQIDPVFANYIIVHRETELEGRSNVYIAPNENDKNLTTVSVNTRYIMTFKRKGELYAEGVSGEAFLQSNIPEKISSVSFNTNRPSTSLKEDPISCFSTGRLEKEILDFNKKLQ